MKNLLIVSILVLFFGCKSSTSNSTDRIKSSGYSISPGATSLADVIIGKFPGIKVEGANMINSSTRFVIRGGTMSMNNPAYAIFDIDGQVYTQYPDFIDPQNIKSIVILKSMIAANKYGSQGRGGAIVIKMKSSQ
ncbi:TonB-dependent receptor plug domain-containing protein [Flavobacteriaceae bacterium]|nr:TonB-dependent receptor plug domain-containing protein [Flavobacteriaceae bacterium]MDB3938148.1 TonB-dependent receptor plug domain-containing protein [Flavobacteriaceae bacterium]MDC0654610.1 TonB-dependent receptor plug domain-containing protein [Flavobacteriaceae bacterium]